MRYYQIIIDGKIAYSSLMPNGQTDPGALNVEMDIIQASAHTPGGDASASVRVWGIPLSTIAQSKNFSGKTISIYGGMSKGLPLANPAQRGLLVQGLIQQAWGNWIGTNMTLDFLVTAGANAPGTAATAGVTPASPPSRAPGIASVRVSNNAGGVGAGARTAGGTAAITPRTPLNLIFNWVAGTPLATAITNTLNQALPGFKVVANISAQLMRTHTVPAFFQNLQQFAEFINAISIDILSASPYGGTGYPGVQMNLTGGTINVHDGTVSTGAVKQIAFTDLVGQPTWINGYQMQATCVMRGDLAVGQTIKLPPSQVTIANGRGFAPGVPRDASIFQGNFMINGLRHVGQYKQPSGTAWVTIIDGYTAPAAA